MRSFGNVVIFGDSYSTYKGYIPEGYVAYYQWPKHRPDMPAMHSVEKTWWHQLLRETGSTLVHNNSWSGSPVSYMGHPGFCPEQSFVTRAREYFKDGCCCGEKIDTVFVFGGTNDYWAQLKNGRPLFGKPQYADWSEADLEEFFPAFCCLLSYLKTEGEGVRIIAVINTDLDPKQTKGMIEICKKMEVEAVVLRDIDKEYGHPTEKGMEQIKEQIIAQCE